MSQDSLLYEVRSCKELGRYLVASRDIQPREIIIREDPLITGPTDRGPKGIPVCLGCYSVMLNNPSNRCSVCHWPVCSEACEKLPCHASNECELFHKNRVLYPPPYGWPYISKSIVILRCILLKSRDPLRWASLMNMSDNKEIRAGKPNCINTDNRILANFAMFMPAQESNYKEMVIQISGIIDTNAHAFPLSINGRSTGQILSVAYDDSQLLVCTLKRLVPNELFGMFVCHCERCIDPTELGSYIGALKCPSCIKGYLLPIDPVDSFSSWKCDNGVNHNKAGESSNKKNALQDGKANTRESGEIGNCNHSLDDESIMEILEEAESLCGYTKLNLSSGEGISANSCGDEGESCLELLKEFCTEYGAEKMHPNHYILLEVNVRILKGTYRKGLSALTHSDLIQYLERCERLLGVANVLTPGFCEYQAFIQFHFCQGLLCLERRKQETKEQERSKRKGQDENDDDEDDENSHCTKADENGDDGNVGSKLKQTEQQHEKPVYDDGDDGSGDELSNGNEVISRKRNKMQFDANLWGKWENSKNNLERLMAMLTFLLAFFQELNPEHRMLEPIQETLADTEIKLKETSLPEQTNASSV